MTQTPVRVAIVEDDEMIRENITDFLDSLEAYHCPISVNSVERYLEEAAASGHADVILMDVGLPGMNGIQGTKTIRAQSQDTEIIMLTVYEDPQKIFEALCAGASGYLLKSTPFNDLERYMNMLRHGGAPMSPRIAYHVVQYFQPQKKKAPSPLSEREREVVDALVDGLSYKEIASTLHISIGTVYTHIKNIYKKLHVHSKAELIKKSYEGEI